MPLLALEARSLYAPLEQDVEILARLNDLVQRCLERMFERQIALRQSDAVVLARAKRLAGQSQSGLVLLDVQESHGQVPGVGVSVSRRERVERIGIGGEGLDVDLRVALLVGGV